VTSIAEDLDQIALNLVTVAPMDSSRLRFLAARLRRFERALHQGVRDARAVNEIRRRLLQLETEDASMPPRSSAEGT
jgi:hypothetical protein